MRFLFTTNPLVGHWLPLLPLIRATERAGYEMVIAAGPDLVADVERRGLTAWSIGNDLATIQAGLRNRPRAADESEQQRLVADGMAMFAVPAVARARDLRARAADWIPDVVVSEIYELGGSWMPASMHVWHGLGAHYPNFVQLAQLCENVVRAELGEPTRRTALAATTYLDPFPAELQPPGETPYEHVISMRPEAGEIRPDEKLPAAVTELPHELTIYLTLGTLFNAALDFAVPLSALADLEVNVVVTTGQGTDPAVLGELAPDVAAVRFIPQALLLPRCAAVVCHAGAGTIIGSLANGVPLVCLPRGADQFGNAQAVDRSGAGIMLPPDAATVAGIRVAVQRVLAEPSYAAAARQLQRVIAALPEPSAVVDALVARASGDG